MSLSSRAVAYLQAQYRVILHQMRQDAWQEQAGPMLAMLRRIPRGAIAQTRAAVRQISEYGLSGYEGDGVGGSVRVNPRRKRGRNICDAMHFDALEPRMLLSGQTLYWQGGSGTWDLTSTDHWNTAADGSGAYVAFANGDDAVIAGGNDFTITVSSDITTLYGNLILDIGSSTATIDGLNLVGDLTWHSGEITLSNTQLSGNIVLDGGNNTLSLNNSTITNEDSGSGLHWTSGNIALVDSSQLINSGSGGLWLDGGSNILSLDDSSITNAYYYGNGIHWTSGDIVLVDSSQLINSGSSGLWLDGGGNTLSLDNSTIANESYSGDGIHWTSGDIELTDGSQMIHSGYGGLWLGGDNNTLSLDDSTITNEDYYGAGIHWIGGTIELANGSQLLNSVSGGISLDGGTKPLTLDDSSLTNNDCGYPLSWTSGDIVLTNGSQLFSSGNGGISLDGGSNTLSLNNSTITNDYYYGNGIHWISGNIVLMNSSQLINSGNGDLYLDGGSNTLSLNDSTIANEASGNGIHWTGGDIVLVNNSQLINTVSGGLWLDGGGNTLSLNNSTITNVDYYGYGMHWTSGNIVLANGSQINSSPGYYFYLDGKSNSLTLDDSTLDNTGLVQWDSGSILLRNGAQIVSAQIVNDNPSTNPFEIPSGQTVTLDVAAGCVIQGNITNNGTLNWTGSDLSQLENITNNGSIVNGTPTPAVDLSVQANAVSSSVITLQWNALPAEDGHTGFVVLISSDNGQTFSSYATVNGDATSLQVTGLQPVSPYEFQVRAVDADGTVITSAGTPVVWTYDGLAAPTDVQVVKDDNGGFVLTWTDNSDGEASYQVEIKCPSSDNFSLWYTLPANLTSCSVSGDWNGVEVTYRVRAVVTGESAYSAPYTYAFPAIPSSDEGEVYDLQVTVNDPVVNSLGAVVSGSVTLTWKYFGNDEHPTFHLYMNSPAADTGWFEELGYYGYMINNANVDGDTYSVTVYDLFLTWPGGIQIYMDAEGIEGIGTPSEIIPVQLNFMLDPPTNLTITCLSENEGGDYEYLLEWDPSSSPNVTYQLFSTSINIEGNHWLASFEGGDTYCIIYSPSEIDYSSYGLMVRAVTPDQSQVSDMSNIVSSMPVIPALPAPYPLTAKAISDHSVGLEWDNTSNSESGYEIQRSYVNSTDDADWETIASLGKDVTSYVDSGLVAGETYYYRAKALGSGTSLDSSWTSSVSVTMPATSCITCKGNPLGLPDGQVLGGQQWQNAGVTPTGYNNSTPTAGNDWLKAEQLHNGTIVFSAQDGFHIYFGYSGSYYGIGGNPYTLRRQTIFFNGSNQDLLVLGGGTGIQLLFTPFDSNGNGGQFVGMIDAAGHITSVDAVDANGNPLTVTQDLGDGNWQTIAYAYNSSGDVVSRSVTQNGNLTSTFFTAYTYYGANSVNGLPGSLELIADTTDTGDIEYTYMRYYTEGDGSQGKLKYLVTGSSYERLLAYANANGTSVDLLADSVVAQYADNYYEYDNQGRVTKLVAQGNGCSGCQGGFGTTTYSYAANKTVSTNVYNATTYNTWAYRQTEADNSQNLRIITYSNFMGQVMLQITQDLASGQQWMEYYRYDASGRQIMHADPSAVLGYDEALPDLVGAGYGGVASNYQYLADHDGLIEWTDYNSLGYQVDTAVMQGDGGTSGTVKHYQTLTTYSSNYANGETYYYISAQTWFSEDVASSPSIYSTGAQTTYYSYGWISGTNQVQWEVVTLPTVNSVENGPGTADVWRTYYDSFGRLVWTMDPDGYVNYTQYDPVTGAVTLSITDKTLSPAEQSLFNSLGWTNYHSSGLNLETTYEVDSQGRTVKITSPDGTITRIVYDDAHQAIYSFVEASESLDANGDGTITPLGPVTMSRGNMLYTMANGNFAMYDEYLTFSGDFSVVNNEIQLPTWCEGGGGNDALLDLTTNGFTLQTLSRWLYNTALQLVESDSYAAIDNATYLSTAANSPYSGTAGANFYATSYYYDVSGQQARTVNADGAIAVTTYDALGRQLATYVGTNDGNWEDFLRAVSANPLAIPAGTDMTLVTLYQYDNDGIGDSNLTQITEFPGGSEAPRITQYLYDWQDRMIASKVGVQTNETGNTSFINYNVLNNIGQVTASYTFAADNIPLANFADSGALVTYASQLRSYSTTLYDAQGRAYQSATYSVDPTTGTISSDAIVSNVWYDHCGNVVKSQTSGGPVSKTSYDGAGRVVASYLTDGGGDAAAGTANTWADAQNVIGDIVLEQVEYLYDANSNVILVTDRQRFDDATGTGELGDPSSTTQPKARVSYSLSYYDVGGRLIANVEVGTNGGVMTNANGGLNLITDTNADGIPDVLQGSVPARSDTVLVTSYGYNAAGLLDTVTDPRGITSKYFYDSLGQTLFTVAAWDGSYDPTTGALPSSDDANQTTGYTYNAVGQTLTMTAVMPFGQNSQTTGYVYNSNGTLALVKYPDPTTGTESSNASAQNRFTYNNLGQVLTMTDQNGTVHTYTYDTLGRQISDAVTIAPGNPQNIDSSILRIETSYNSQSLVEYITSYNAATGGVIVNQVQNVYNGLGQLITQYQEHAGSVNPSTTPKVQYAYDTLSQGSRLISMTYPDGTILSYSYGASGSLNDTISRLTFLAQSGTTVESYVYLGYSTVVMRLHPEDGVDLTYIKIGTAPNGDAGDKYTGLDRFGRIIDQRWIDASGADVDRYQYTYDRDSNVTAKTNVLDSTFNETYTYDNLNRLISTDRDNTAYQSWELDALGNMNSVTTDGTTVDRTNNDQNQLTSVGSNPLTYDNNGNTTTDDLGRTLIYDAWNRLVTVNDSSGSTLTTYAYDGLNHRITESPAGQAATQLYYSAQWQVIEERVDSQTSAQYVWSPVYVNALILRDDQMFGRIYALQDANFNTTAILCFLTKVSYVVDGWDPNFSGTWSGWEVTERFAYDSYGSAMVLNSGWTAQSNDYFNWKYTFQGGRQDAITGFINFQRRDYNPRTYTWNTQDQLIIDGLDRYDFVTNNPINKTDATGLYTVSIVIYVDTVGRPSTFNRANVEANIRAMFSAVSPPHGNKFTISLVDRDASTVLPTNLGFHYDKPGGSYNASGWDYVPLVNIGTKSYRACTKRVQQYNGLVKWTSGTIMGSSTGNLGEISPPAIITNATTAGLTPNWDITFANFISHEVIYHAMMGYWLHYGPKIEFTSGSGNVDTLQTIPSWFSEKFIKKLDLDKP